MKLIRDESICKVDRCLTVLSHFKLPSVSPLLFYVFERIIC